MKSFLEQVAADLLARYGDGVSALHTIFPSRRAALFFGEALAGMISRPMWQPATITLDQVAEELSGLAVGDRLRLVTELFKVYREAHPSEDFDSFYFWGELLLGDFEAVDKYMVDADALFSNLVDLHQIDFVFDTPEQRAMVERFWGSFSRDGNASPEQRDFLAVWRTLAPVYKKYKARLKQLGIAYQGMVYREAAERIEAGTAPKLPERRYVIAGFNALSRSEQVIFSHLRDAGAAGKAGGTSAAGADFYWDHDDYFTADARQEAGMFMRDNLRRFPQASALSGGHNNFLKPKHIRSVAAASDVLQCKWAGGALTDIARRTGRAPGRETAVVLCDETLLEPLLWSIPPEVGGINITMGHPLRMHPAYTFVERLVELQHRRRGGAFYHSDVEGLVRHPFLAQRDAKLDGGHNTGHDAGLAGKNNFIYISAKKLRTTPLLEKIFATPEGWHAVSEWLIEVLAAVDKSNALFSLIADHIIRLANSLDGCDIELATRTWARLLRRTLQSVTIPFEGEPLEGVQVMGILETRALDFENIIFLSAGDDTMPGSLVGAPSFIPYNLKSAYGLPTPEHHEGVYAYHFFRLISRAHNVDVVWSRTSDDRSSGAPSRYLLQLDYESPHEVAREAVSVDVNLSPVEAIEVAKDATVVARLGEFLGGEARRALSPSLLYSYVECPLKFYFRGVARLRVADEMSEEVDGALLGNILHRAMQILYEPLAEVADPRATIRGLIGSAAVDEAVGTAVAELCPGDDGAEGDRGGSVMLAHRTVVSYIDRAILPYDAALPGAFTIEGLEKEIAGEFAFEVDNGGGGGKRRTVLFRGIADRIDRTASGAARIVDYKTGNPANNASALLQMGIYAMMLSEKKSNDDGEVPSTALYYVRDMSRPDYTPPPVDQGPGFEEDLRAILAELFDPARPFTQTPDARRCEWCDYRPVCRR
jgi:RecB family exonuclease